MLGFRFRVRAISMGVMNKKFGTNGPSFGQFVQNLEVMKKKIGTN